MIRRPKPERFRLRRTMMFMNAQKPGLIKDAYIYGCDSIMLDLEDAVAGSTVWTPLTGRRTSGSEATAALTASASPSAKAHRMYIPWKPLWKRLKRNSAWKWAEPC